MSYGLKQGRFPAMITGSRNQSSQHSVEYKWYCFYRMLVAEDWYHKMFWYLEGTKRVDTLTDGQRKLLHNKNYYSREYIK